MIAVSCSCFCFRFSISKKKDITNEILRTQLLPDSWSLRAISDMLIWRLKRSTCRIWLQSSFTKREFSFDFGVLSYKKSIRYVNDVEKRVERLESCAQRRNELRSMIASLESETAAEERLLQKVKMPRSTLCWSWEWDEMLFGIWMGFGISVFWIGFETSVFAVFLTFCFIRRAAIFRASLGTCWKMWEFCTGPWWKLTKIWAPFPSPCFRKNRPATWPCFEKCSKSCTRDSLSTDHSNSRWERRALVAWLLLFAAFCRCTNWNGEKQRLSQKVA